MVKHGKRLSIAAPTIRRERWTNFPNRKCSLSESRFSAVTEDGAACGKLRFMATRLKSSIPKLFFRKRKANTFPTFPFLMASKRHFSPDPRRFSTPSLSPRIQVAPCMFRSIKMAHLIEKPNAAPFTDFAILMETDEPMRSNFLFPMSIHHGASSGIEIASTCFTHPT